MVLHLLGKKSWNVYNADNVDRVRRDEAEADARERAEEQRMQEEDAARRIARLRGAEIQTSPHLHLAGKHAADSVSANDDHPTPSTRSHSHADDPQLHLQRPERKRRRLRGEDETDRDIRYARDDARDDRRLAYSLVRAKERDAPLQDDAGNIQLIPAPHETTTRRAQKNAEAEAEKDKKRKREEDQYTMRFSNAAGFRNGMSKPWYASGSPDAVSKNTTSDLTLADTQGKDVWGNEDPRRKDRERSRIVSSDPFAAMQHAQRQLKQSERDREAYRRKQLAEIEQLEREAKSQRRERRRHRHESDRDSLDGFSLDALPRRTRDDRGHDERRRRHHHR